MKTISLLNLISSSFISTSSLRKIELYLFPLIIIYFVFYFFDKNKTNTAKNNEVKQLIDDEIYVINNTKYKGTFIDIQKDLNTFTKKFNIKIISLNTKKNTIFLKIRSSSKKLISLIEYCENYNNFSFLSEIVVKKDSKTKLLISELKINFNKYFIKSKLSSEFQEKNKKKKLHLKAIVSKYININDKWLNIGDKIDGYTIKSINNKNQVILEKESKVIILRIYNYEKNTKLYN